MRRFHAVLLTVLLLASPLMADDEAATANVSTSVTGFLLHGFLEENDKTLRDTTTVDDALGQDGATLYYTIHTNQLSSMMVYAAITPFTLESDNTHTISIDSVEVDGVELSPVNGLRYQNNQLPASPIDDKEDKTLLNTTTYELIDFTGKQGTTEYNYTICVKANQEEVAKAPAGHYVSSFTISLAYKN